MNSHSVIKMTNQREHSSTSNEDVSYLTDEIFLIISAFLKSFSTVITNDSQQHINFWEKSETLQLKQNSE